MSLENKLGSIVQLSSSLLLLSWPHLVLANPVPAPAATTVYYSKPSKGNPLGINWDPAPPPQFGPPLSAHASRNRALLPGQISTIVGAYIFTLFIVGIALFYISRKLRRELLENAVAVNLPTFPDTELLESKFKSDSTDPSPSSPQPLSARNFSWPSNADEKRSPTSYAFAVGPVVRSDSTPYVLPPTVSSEATPYVYPSLKSKSALEINTNVVDHKVVEADRENLQRGLEDIYAHVMEQEELKAAGVDVKRIPPPRFPMGPIPGESPQRGNKQPKLKPMPIDTSETKSNKSLASSILSSIMSPRSKKSNKSSLRISSPIMTPLSASFSPGSNSDEEPLSPRFYAPPPAPPIPGGQSPHSPISPHFNPDISPTRSIADTLSKPSFERPRGNQSNVSLSQETRSLKLSLKDSNNPKSPDSATTPKASNYPSNTPTTVTQASPVSATSGTSRVLPFRQFEPESQFQSMNSTTATKTTVLERTNRSNGGPQTAGLTTPWSGGAVPYSPYQPFTPMIPVTPRLVTKEDRKAMKKAMKAVPKTPTMHMVADDDDVWDSGY